MQAMIIYAGPITIISNIEYLRKVLLKGGGRLIAFTSIYYV